MLNGNASKKFSSFPDNARGFRIPALMFFEFPKFTNVSSSTTRIRLQRGGGEEALTFASLLLTSSSLF